MRGKRLRQTLRLWTILGSPTRARYMKEHGIFASMGDGCTIMSRKVPLFGKLIKIGNNVHLASNVSLVTHDITHSMLNKSKYVKEKLGKDYRFCEKLGCIEIGDDVFVGAGTTILQNVRIGSHVIIGACSLVNKDIPDNCVAAGVPAKVICSFDEYLEKRMKDKRYPEELATDNGLKKKELVISDKLAEWCWASFDEKRKA